MIDFFLKKTFSRVFYYYISPLIYALLKKSWHIELFFIFLFCVF